MPDSTSHELYKACVVNTRDLIIAEKDIRRSINRSLKAGKPISSQTKVYALIYSTFSEANFMKMILTPYGFEQKYVDQILEQENIYKKWEKCIELAFSVYKNRNKGSEIPNKTLEIKKIINTYIVEPSLIRNKIAHGQPTIALNRENNRVNDEITEKLKTLNYTTIHKWFIINQKLSRIIEDLIESPNRAHYNNYYRDIENLKDFIEESKNWSIESKLQIGSMKKPIKYKDK